MAAVFCGAVRAVVYRGVCHTPLQMAQNHNRPSSPQPHKNYIRHGKNHIGRRKNYIRYNSNYIRPFFSTCKHLKNKILYKPFKITIKLCNSAGLLFSHTTAHILQEKTGRHGQESKYRHAHNAETGKRAIFVVPIFAPRLPSRRKQKGRQSWSSSYTPPA